MNIIAKDFSMATASYDIFFSGCNMAQHCTGCHNMEAWDFNKGTDFHIHLKEISENLRLFKGAIKRVFILGGEPLDQNRTALEEFITYIRKECNELNIELWLFTRYELCEIDTGLLYNFDYIKCGPYKEELTTDNNIQYNVKLATSNQNIYKRGEHF